MTIVGMNYSVNAAGERTTTLHVTDDFNLYYKNIDAGRGCVGKKVESIFVGNYDCNALKIGMEIDVLYEKAITTGKGTFQQVKKIEVISGNK